MASAFRRKIRLLLILTAALCLLALWLRLGALPSGLLDDPAPSTIVVDRHGVPLYEARGGDGTRGIKLTADNLPPNLVTATLVAEDRRFWSHPGVDLVSVLRAAKTNVIERSVVEGGSTISQQVAKLLLNRRKPARTRGWIAKVHEAVIALRLEHRFEKREILAMYLNLASYGNQISGAERASRAYFGSPVALVTPAQAAFLAGLPQRPSGFNPYKSREAALSRQRVVLRRMESAGALTSEQASRARDERLALRPLPSPFIAPHFVEMVLASSAGARESRVETTLDAGLQSQVVGIIESHRPALRRHGAANVGVVVLDNATGEWLAWEGSGDYLDAAHGGTINGPAMPRQPGSALKPFTYALAFEEGFSPASVLADIPSSFPTAEPGIVYNPRNYDGRYRGPMLARAALAGSENVPAVALASELGIPKLLRLLGRAGLSTFEKTAAHYGLGLTLGNAEVRLDELTAAYSALARGGEWLEPTWRLRSPGDRVLRRAVSPRTAFWITDILSDDEAREYVFGRGGSLEFPFQVAVKTGTSQAYHDNWTVGYSKRVTVGVWVGNFDRTPLRNSSGVTGAAPIFQSVMLATEQRNGATLAEYASPAILRPTPDLARAEICGLSGGAANAWCPSRRREWMPTPDTLLPCSWHHHGDEGLITILPDEYAAWKRELPLRGRETFGEGAGSSLRGRETFGEGAGSSLRGRKTGAEGAGSSPRVRTARFAIVSPPDGATYLIDPTLRRQFQTLPLKVAGAYRGPVAWRVDGRPLSSAAPGLAIEWPLAAGSLRIEARDASGRIAEAMITVR